VPPLPSTSTFRMQPKLHQRDQRAHAAKARRRWRRPTPRPGSRPDGLVESVRFQRARLRTLTDLSERPESLMRSSVSLARWGGAGTRAARASDRAPVLRATATAGAGRTREEPGDPEDGTAGSSPRLPFLLAPNVGGVPTVVQGLYSLSVSGQSVTNKQN
jgi:hypothetical protein